MEYEGAGGLVGGGFLIAEPDGRLMDMPVEIMHDVFPDFLIPGIILLTMGILTVWAFIAVIRRMHSDWLLTWTSLVGWTIWFSVEIAILQGVHWLHAMWGLPVLIGMLAAIPANRSRVSLRQGSHSN